MPVRQYVLGVHGGLMDCEYEPDSEAEVHMEELVPQK